MRVHLGLAAAALPLMTALTACPAANRTPSAGAAHGAQPASGAIVSKQRVTLGAELFYRERIALPPGAVAVAALQIAGSDTVVAKARQPVADRRVPIPVTLDVDRLQLPQDAGLVFLGRIEVDGAVRWESEPRPVDVTSDTVDLGAVMLRAAPEPDAMAAAAPVAQSLQDGTWVVEDILGGGIIDSSRVTLDFSDQGLAGRASCNRYRSSWSLDNGRLSIGNIAATKMGCADALMNQERRFLDTLVSVDGFRFDDTGALFLTRDDEDVMRAHRGQ